MLIDYSDSCAVFGEFSGRRYEAYVQTYKHYVNAMFDGIGPIYKESQDTSTDSI
jgi:hypothetical protein